MPKAIQRNGDPTTPYSGTSMAAPQVAGASIILRELMEIVGGEEVTQDDIYDHMVETSRSIYDSTTNKSYFTLDMKAAVDALIPQDEFGDTLSSAFDFGDLHSGQSIQGFLDAEMIHDNAHNGKITGMKNLDVDYLSFTATETGTLTLNLLNDGLSKIDLAWLLDDTDGEIINNTLLIDTVEGQSYNIALTTEEGIGHYRIESNYLATEETVLSAEVSTEDSSLV